MSLHFIITFAPVVIANNEPKALKNPRGKKRTIYIYIITTAQNKPRRVRGSSTFSSFSPLAVQEPLRLPIPTSVHVFPSTDSPHQTHSSTLSASTPNTLHTFSRPTLSPAAPLALALSTRPSPLPLPGHYHSSSSPPALDHPANRPASPLSSTAPRGNDARFRETIFHAHSQTKRGKRSRSR